MKKIRVYWSVAAVVAIMSSCASTKNLAPVSDLSGEWNIIEINGTAVVPAAGQTFPFIGFETNTGRVYGNSGCNRLMGSFDTGGKPGQLELGQMGSTRMMCPDMTLEKNVLTALAQVKKFTKLGDGQIALCGKSLKRPVMILQQRLSDVSAADLNGRWKIVQAGGEDIPDGMEKQPFLELNVNEKRVHGNAGCNTINGGFVTDESNTSAISFPNLISTMMACPDMEVEGRITKALGEVKTFARLENGGFGFYNATGGLVLVLVKE